MTMQLGQMIRQQRKALGLTQEQLAERISNTDHVTQTDISRIESGKVKLPNYQRLHRLAVTLNLPIGALLAHSGWAGAEAAFANLEHPVLDHLTDAFYLVDRDGCFTYVNQHAADLAGQTAAEMHGTTAWGQGTKLHDALILAAAQRATSQQVIVRIESYDPSSDTWFESDFYPGPDGLMVVSHEISARHRTTVSRGDDYVELRSDHPTALSANRDDSRRYANVHHDLQSLAKMIVESVKLFRHHLNTGHESDSQTIMQCLDTIEQTATRVADRLESLIETAAHPTGLEASPPDAADRAIRGHHEFLRWRRDRHVAETIARPDTHQPGGRTDSSGNDQDGGDEQAGSEA